MEKNDVILTQIERFVKYLRKLDDRDINNLGLGLMKIEFAKRNISNADDTNDYTDIADFVKELQSINTREEVQVLLEGHSLKKKDLEYILNYMEVHYNKKDNKQKLLAKIAEVTVGSKLRSEAIKNK